MIGEQVEELILSELSAIAEKGFTKTAIEAAINTIEFAMRENNTGSFPRGLSLMLRATSAWIYDQDPFQPLQWREDLAHFKVSLFWVFLDLSSASLRCYCFVCILMAGGLVGLVGLWVLVLVMSVGGYPYHNLCLDL
jgi:hypothetical protein